MDNYDRSGNLLQSIDDISFAGPAPDPANDRLYIFGNQAGLVQIQTRSLDTLGIVSSVPTFCCGGDVAFDGEHIWKAGGFTGSADIFTIDPITGNTGDQVIHFTHPRSYVGWHTILGLGIQCCWSASSSDLFNWRSHHGFRSFPGWQSDGHSVGSNRQNSLAWRSRCHSSLQHERPVA